MTIESRFNQLGTDNAPGQEVRQQSGDIEAMLRGDVLDGRPVDFSHGDVDAFVPAPGSFEAFSRGVAAGGRQAYTEYRGDSAIRDDVAARLATFIGAPVDAREGMIVTPGSQGALFLAAASTISRGDKIAVVQPDYFANRKLVAFFEGEILPVRMHYATARDRSGLDLDDLEGVFKAGAKVFIFSNPNNPVGVIYAREEIERIAAMADRYGVTVIVDQLYSRLLYSGLSYTHLHAQPGEADNVITIMGPSKTESLSGYRLGVAFGSKTIIARMEKLQAIVSLRAAGYGQAVLNAWLNEPEGWLGERIRHHQAIRDDLLSVLRAIPGVSARTPEAGSYLFPGLPDLSVSHADFVRILRLQAGVIVTHGSEFSPLAGNRVRMNFSQDHAAAVSACKRFATLVDRYRA